MIQIPDAYKVLCAKTDRKQEDLWLPLWMHLTDTADVMEYLCCHWLSDSAIKAIGLEREELRCFCRFLGMIHDLGKGTTLFQYQITQKKIELREKLSRYKWGIKAENLKPGVTKHALAGEAIMQLFGFPESAALIVGSHHGKPSDNDRAVKDNMGAYQWNYRLTEDGSDQWTDFWKYWLAYASDDAGYAGVSEIPDVHMRAQMILSGLLIMADWIASNTYYFPLVRMEEEPELSVYPLRTEKALSRLELPEKTGWSEVTRTAVDFKCRFGFLPNSIQSTMIDIVSKTTEPGIFILEAQMGIGKTEAALAAVEICAEKSGAEGFFFGLPTQATADGIFLRLSQWGEKLSDAHSHSIRLVHGMAEYNEDYISLKEGFLNMNDDSEIFDGSENEYGLIVHEWFSGKKKALLADYVVGTVDQLLMADLRQKHVMLRHLGLAGKIVVVDECHAYDAYMSRYLQGALRWLGAYRIPVILLSATLPAARREELVQAYTGVKGTQCLTDLKSRAYPLLTWSDCGLVHQMQVSQGTGRKIEVEIHWGRDENIADELQHLLEEGGCAGIIVNTVQRAQIIYEELVRASMGMRIILCHAQMLAPDRLEKERLLTTLVGKESGKADRSRVIIIGTSVLEQSLDIDFDVLYSDLCPMDLLLQRIGRLHRHAHHDSIREKQLEKPVCHVLCGLDPELESGGCNIYGDYLLMRTKHLLPEKIFIPKSIPDLVQETYDDANDFGLTGEKYKAAKETYLVKVGKKGQKAGVYQIADPDMRESYNRRSSLRGLLKKKILDRDNRAEAAVRDAGNSIDILLLMRDENGEIRYLPWQNGGICIPTYTIPSEEECMMIARQRIRLPQRFCHDGIIDRTISELEAVYRKFFFEWRESSWLGRELILLLDNNLKTKLDGISIQYSFEEGLICGREDDA